MADRNGWPLPVVTRKRQSAANYERCSRFLLENYRELAPAFGSHNIRSLAHALACGDLLGLPAGSYEFQMLYGMADPVKQALVGMGQRVRIYTPYGQLLPGMAYLVRRLLENTSNESFLRASFKDQKPEDQLLMDPTAHTHEVVHDQTPRHIAAFTNEPLADFSREENRRAMQDALTQVAGQFGKQYPLVVNGDEITTPTWIESNNPSNWQQIVRKCASPRRSGAEAAIAAAKGAL